MPQPTVVPVKSVAIVNNQTKPQSKLVNFDSEITELVSGLKLNMERSSKDNCREDIDIDDKLLEEPDDMMLSQPAINCDIDLLTPEFDPLPVSAIESVEPKSASPKDSENLNKPLSEFIIDLNTIRPHDEHQSRCILDEPNGLKILLNFTKDHPRSDVAVMVITTTNHNNAPLSNYQFEASASKVCYSCHCFCRMPHIHASRCPTQPCRIHLQKASGSELPAVKPFRPPCEDITQCLLLSNPDHKPIRIMCIISYVLGNDPDPVKEFVEINDLPELF